MKIVHLIILSILSESCSTFPKPFRKKDLITYSTSHPEKALAHYLKDTNADPIVCSKDRGYLKKVVDESVPYLFKTFANGEIAPDHFLECMTHYRKHRKSINQAVYREALLSLQLLFKNQNYKKNSQIVTLNSLINSSNEVAKESIDFKVIRKSFAKILINKSKHKLNSDQISILEDLIMGFDARLGQYKGQKITKDLINKIQAEEDLKSIMINVKNSQIKKLVIRRLISLRIDKSPYKELHRKKNYYLSKVAKSGKNSWPIKAIKSVKIDDTMLGQIIVNQDHRSKSSKLSFSFGSELRTYIDLRNRIIFEAKGIEKTLTICSNELYLVSPCIDPSLIKINKNKFLSVHRLGRLEFKRNISTSFLSKRSNLNWVSITLKIGDRLISSLKLSLAYTKPEALFLTGSTSNAGPELQVTIERTQNHHIISTLRKNSSATPDQYIMIVPNIYKENTYVFSQGGNGYKGRDGKDGYKGINGLRGRRGTDGQECGSNGGNGEDGSNGSNGSDGMPGTPGGDGGNGGNIYVTLKCKKGCDEFKHYAAQMVASKGGKGGEGGKGGKGGEGGTGGKGGQGGKAGYCSFASSTNKTATRSRGFSGLDGRDGSKGSDGKDGDSGSTGNWGSPGRIKILVSSD